MPTFDIQADIKSQEHAIELLEGIRWPYRPECPYCKDANVARHLSDDRQVQRWQCYRCKRSFSVTVGTIFHRTHVPLKQWFIVLNIVLTETPKNKTAPSISQISRDIGLRRATVSAMVAKIRNTMVTDKRQAELLREIVNSSQ